MKIGDRCFVHGYIDEIRKDTVIIRNAGGYFGTILSEVTGELPSAQADLGKYEYHYDHTDCIWYRPEARNRCPATCAQYRDGWNDAMNYIFRDGKGYRPYRRGEQYEE